MKANKDNRVYFAHPQTTYYSSYASDYEDKIRRVLGEDIDIVNPDTITEDMIRACREKHSDNGKNDFINEMLYIYLPMLQSCKYFAYIHDRSGIMTSGVRYELGYAYDNNLDIIDLDGQ